MSPDTTIYLLDDEPAILVTVSSVIEGALGCKVAAFLPGALPDFYRRAVVEKPGLYILDQHLSPTLKGTDVLVRLRGLGITAPVIFLSAESDPDLPVKSLDLSADDFVRKPFSEPEMLARIRAVLRRTARADDPRIRGGAKASDDDFQFAGCLFSPRNVCATGPSGASVQITPYCMAVAHLLHSHAGAVVTRREFITRIWGADVPEKSRVIDQAVYDIRRRVGRLGGDPDCIVNIKSVGYRYTPPAKGKLRPRADD